MNIFVNLTIICFAGFSFIGSNSWIEFRQSKYSVYYTLPDKPNIETYNKIFLTGFQTTEQFFGQPFLKTFQIVVHPNRASLDSTWQKDWGMPDFKSECWMVASGVAVKLDMISPKLWDTESCEHKYANTEKVQQLLTHELIHVFHGQRNGSPTFETDGLDWFVEGLATYASGQLDSARFAPVKQAIAENKIPASLDKFWSGKLRYGLSGSVVRFIDKTYGRKMILELLPLTSKTEVLKKLNLTEEELLSKWKAEMMSI